MSFSKHHRYKYLTLILTSSLLFSFALIAGLAQTSEPESLKLKPLFPTTGVRALLFHDSIIANPILDLTDGYPVIIVPDSGGILSGLNGQTGELAWRIALPSQTGQAVQLAATPVKVENKLVVIFQCLFNGVRVSHKMAVIDLVEKKLDSNFQILELSAELSTPDGQSQVKFNPPTAYSHAALKYVPKPEKVWGNIYAALGNAGDIQPFHGWLFEINMAAWKLQGAKKAIRNVLLTTPESKCPVNLEHGTQEMICGGGIWTPAGPQIYPARNAPEIYLPVGNGQVDLARRDYANSVMKVQPGLKFDPGCDATLCNAFDPVQPDEACLSSCKNLFIPRLQPNDAPLKPANGECDNKTFWECLAWMDYDLGASAPVRAELKDGRRLLIQPGKEGGVYLIDADHLGTQYDRIQLVDVCGTAADPCKAGWMGMIVTHPVLTYLGDDPVVIIPTFVPDKTHPAGLIALKILLNNGKPQFRKFWQFPPKTSNKAAEKFRSHPALPVITRLKNNDAVVWTVDIGNPGMLYAIRVKDGRVLVEQPLSGTGRQLSEPVIYQETVYLASTQANSGKAFIEAWRIEQDHPY